MHIRKPSHTSKSKDHVTYLQRQNGTALDGEHFRWRQLLMGVCLNQKIWFLQQKMMNPYYDQPEMYWWKHLLGKDPDACCLVDGLVSLNQSTASYSWYRYHKIHVCSPAHTQCSRLLHIKRLCVKKTSFKLTTSNSPYIAHTSVACCIPTNSVNSEALCAL